MFLTLPKLINDKFSDCEHEPVALHSLSKKIGIEDWLIRSVEAAVETHSKINKPFFGRCLYEIQRRRRVYYTSPWALISPA